MIRPAAGARRWTCRPAPTSTPSPATTCRPPTSGRRSSSPRRAAAVPRPAQRRRRAHRRPVAAIGPDRPALRTPTATTWTYGELLTARQPGRPGAGRGPRSGPAATGCCCARPTTRGRSRPGSASSRPAASWSRPWRRCGPASWRRSSRRPGRSIALVDHRFVDDVDAVRRHRRPDLVVVAYGGDGDGRPDPPRRGQVRRLRRGRHRGRRRRAVRPDVREHRRPEDHHALPPRHAVDRQHLRPARPARCEPDDVVACTAPLAFTFGLGMLVVFPLRAGACALLTEAATPVAARRPRRRARRHRAGDRADGVPGDPQVRRDRASSPGLRAAVTAGEHIPQAVWEQLARRARAARSSTASARPRCCTSSSPPPATTSAPARPASRCPATAPRSSAPTATSSARAQRAGSRVIGPVGCRYLDDERQRGYVVNGWNVTGDTFVRDEDGYYFYRARTDNMIVSSGYNIGGPEVEAAIDTHPDVVESAVVGRARPRARLGRLRVRRAARGRRRRRREGQGDPGLRQGPAGAVQVPARRALRRRAAAQHQRQAAALPSCGERIAVGDARTA